mgnify:CR=1 FL=1|jgi:hypothetical protein
MKKALIFVAVIGVFALALSVAGFAYAQDDDPDGPWGGRGWHGRGMMGHWDDDAEYGPLHETMHSALAEALGLTVEELDAAHEEGKTGWDIAEEQGMSGEDFFSMMSTARSAALEQAVADGTISQEQADWMQSRWDEMEENGYGPGSGRCHDDDFQGRGRGHGMNGYWNSQP